MREYHLCLVCTRTRDVEAMEAVDYRDILVSYEYLRRDDRFLRKVIDFEGFKILDSGKFTVISQYDKGKVGDEYVKNYREAYLEFVKEYGEYFDGVVEWDWDYWTHSELENYREKMLKYIDLDRLIVVVSDLYIVKERRYLGELKSKYNYLALGSLVGTGARWEGLERRLTDVVGDVLRKKKVHILGLGVDEARLACRYAIFSSDCSTWANVDRYGTVIYFDGTKLVECHREEAKHNLVLAKYLEEKGFGYTVLDVFERSAGDVRFEITIQAFKDYVKHVMEQRQRLSAGVTGFCCKNCVYADKCAYYDEEADSCRLVDERLRSITLEGVNEEVLRLVIEERLKRYIRARVFEDLGGGILDKHVTQLEEGLAKLVDIYMKLKYPEKYTGKEIMGADAI